MGIDPLTLLASQPTGSGGEYAVAFDPGGEVILSAGRDGMVRQFAATTGELLSETRVCFSDLVDIKTSPDGHLVAAQCSTGVGFEDQSPLVLLSSGSLQELGVIGDSGSIKPGFGFNATGDLLAIASYPSQSKAPDMLIEFWNPNTMTLIATLPGDFRAGGMPVFSPDGRLLAISEGDGIVQLFGVVSP